ncbi:MAG: hypothetical protein QOE97_1757 [Pseudonocardiales bacterium]|jgi:hypothetical protein|nr:hypothetical protein [Pseudonocardiales bacterium]
MAGVTRRAVLLAGTGGVAAAVLGGAGIESGLLPGRDALERLTGRLPAGVPSAAPGRRVSGSFRSDRRHTWVGWTIAYPPGATGRVPAVVVLHGRGADHRSAFSSLYLDRFLAQAVERGSPRFALASVDGGDHEYWHPRDGTDPAGMVVDEFLPLLGGHGLDTSRIGLLGWSMGGYGALYLAGVLGASRVAGAVAESPAMWHTAGQTAPGAFDGAADFAAHSVLGRVERLRGIALQVDCGSADGFAPVTRDLRAAITPEPAGGITPGGHDDSYWRGRAAGQLRFLAARLG